MDGGTTEDRTEPGVAAPSVLPVRADGDWVQIMNESLETVAALLGG